MISSIGGKSSAKFRPKIYQFCNAIFYTRKVWNRPTYETNQLSCSDSTSRHPVEYQKCDAGWDRPIALSERIISKEIPSSSSTCTQLPRSIISDPKPYDGKPSDYLNDRQTPAAATVLLPSPTLPRDLNHQITQNTPLKITVKKATKYLGLSKSLGIKVTSKTY